MASKISGSRKLKKSSLPKFEADVYSTIPSDGLIVFAVHYLIEQKIEITLEDIVSVCFLLFPHKFRLKRYPKWPDSAPVSRHWGDVRRKRYVTANDYLGYRLTTKGIRFVKKAAKVLGVSLPKPIVKVRPVQEAKATPPAPIKKVRSVRVKKATPPASSIKKAQPVRAKKATSTPVKQVEIPEIKVQPAIQVKKATSPAPIKKVRPVRAKKVSPAPVKQVETIRKKTQPVQEEKATQLELIKNIQPTRAKKVSPFHAPVKQVETPKNKIQPVIKVKKKQAEPVLIFFRKTAPIQPVKATTKNIKPSLVKKTKPAEPVIVHPVKVEKAQAQKAQPAAPSNVTREAKERAGKFTRMMERSDAYLHYKKNGSKSHISEFDFRSLLLCTMESSAETLARNVGLFKGYAGIHNRQDLNIFLTFCEDKFSYLLKPQNKPTRKAKK